MELATSGEVLSNWLYKRARSRGGFSEGKLSLSLSLLVLCWARVCYGRDELFVSVPKGKILLQQER